MSKRKRVKFRPESSQLQLYCPHPSGSSVEALKCEFLPNGRWTHPAVKEIAVLITRLVHLFRLFWARRRCISRRLQSQFRSFRSHLHNFTSALNFELNVDHIIRAEYPSACSLSTAFEMPDMISVGVSLSPAYLQSIASIKTCNFLYHLQLPLATTIAIEEHNVPEY